MIRYQSHLLRAYFSFWHWGQQTWENEFSILALGLVTSISLDNCSKNRTLYMKAHSWDSCYYTVLFVALSPWNSMTAFSTAWLIVLNTGMNFDLVLCKCFISANSFVCKNASRVEGVAGTHQLISVLRRRVFEVVSRLGVCLCSQIYEVISVLSE